MPARAASYPRQKRGSGEVLLQIGLRQPKRLVHCAITVVVAVRGHTPKASSSGTTCMVPWAQMYSAVISHMQEQRNDSKGETSGGARG